MNTDEAAEDVMDMGFMGHVEPAEDDVVCLFSLQQIHDIGFGLHAGFFVVTEKVLFV